MFFPRCSGNALQSYLANWNPAKQVNADLSQSTRRLSAFVKPQRLRQSNASSSSSSQLFTSHPDRDHVMTNISGSNVPIPPLLQQSLTNGPPSSLPPGPPDPFTFNSVLPYHHPTPMWASSNIFYHFAIPPPPTPPQSLAQSGQSSAEISSLYGGRPLHLPPPTGCTIPGCRDCVSFSPRSINPHPQPQLSSAVEMSYNSRCRSRSASGETASISSNPGSPNEDNNSNSAIDVDTVRDERDER
jgi:hypothetical protein